MHQSTNTRQSVIVVAAVVQVARRNQRGGKKKKKRTGDRAHVATINLHSDVIGEEQVTEQEDFLSRMVGSKETPRWLRRHARC